MVRGKVAWLCALQTVLALGCGSGGVPQGHERGACYDNGTCEPGLTCASDLCVRLVVDGGPDTKPNSGTAGSGATGAAGAGGTGTGTGGTDIGGTGGSGTGGTDTGGTFAVAAHPPLPQIANLGGPVLSTPKVRPIFFAGETDQTEIMSFLFEV